MDKLTLAQLAQHIAKASGYRQEFCEQFVAELFRTIRESLSESESVTINALGTFSLDNGNVIFRQGESVAEIVNSPFSFFEPEEINDDFDMSLIEDTETATEPAQEEQTEPYQPSVSSEEEMDEIQSVSKNEDNLATYEAPESVREAEENTEAAVPEPEEPETAETDNVTETQPDVVNEDPVETDSVNEYYAKKSRQKLHIALSIITSFFAGFAVCYFTYDYLFGKSNASHEQTQQTAENDTTPVVSTPAETTAAPEEITSDGIVAEGIVADEIVADETAEQPTDSVITETVTSSNYLAQMARRHYGRYEFWVYIYKENESILSDPDLIEPNTVVVIPPAEKYGIDKNDKESINRALNLIEEIYKGKTK